MWWIVVLALIVSSLIIYVRFIKKKMKRSVLRSERIERYIEDE